MAGKKSNGNWGVSLSRTSTEVKRRYNAKTYKCWSVDLRFEDYDRLEELRGELSRAAFLKKLLEQYMHEVEAGD